MCTLMTRLRKGKWELSNLGDGKSELTSLTPDGLSKDSGWGHLPYGVFLIHWIIPWREGQTKGHCLSWGSWV